VKTPWTLENEEVWKRTHRITAKIWTVGGLLLVMIPFLIGNQIIYWSIFGVLISLLVLYPVIYSYVIFQKLDTGK
ncbi:MAG: SdpI family protein, partial [Balneolaceae bacterium]